jgi:hypothetical protein
MKRPPSVWITQALVLIFALLWILSLASGFLMLVRNGTDLSLLRVTVGATILLGVILVLLAAFWGLAKRRIYGKWLGVLSLVLLWAMIVYTQIRPPAGPIKRFEYNSTAELVGAYMSSILISVGFLILTLRLAFAKRVAAFFERTA